MTHLRDVLSPAESRRLLAYVRQEVCWARTTPATPRVLPLSLLELVELAQADLAAWDPDLLLPDDADLVLRAWLSAPTELGRLLDQVQAIARGAPKPARWTDPVPGSTLPPADWDADLWTWETVAAERTRRDEDRREQARSADRHRARAVVEDWRAGRWR